MSTFDNARHQTERLPRPNRRRMAHLGFMALFRLFTERVGSFAGPPPDLFARVKIGMPSRRTGEQWDKGFSRLTEQGWQALELILLKVSRNPCSRLKRIAMLPYAISVLTSNNDHLDRVWTFNDLRPFKKLFFHAVKEERCHVYKVPVHFSPICLGWHRPSGLNVRSINLTASNN